MRIGVGQQLISKWERGLTIPQDEKLALLRTVLKAPLEIPSDGAGTKKTAYEEILSRIEQGVYAPGDVLPAQSSMAVRYGVHIATVRRAVGRLLDEGWLTWRPGGPPVVRSGPTPPTSLLAGTILPVSDAHVPKS